jgi:hypothetical protein
MRIRSNHFLILLFTAIALFSFKTDFNDKYIIYKCPVSHVRYAEEDWVSPKDSIYFKGAVLDKNRSTDKDYYPYEHFRVYCDTTLRDGDKYFWAVQVRTCTYMNRLATYYIGTDLDRMHSLGRQETDSHCHLTTFGAMLPIPPGEKNVYLKVAGLDYGRLH